MNRLWFFVLFSTFTISNGVRANSCKVLLATEGKNSLLLNVGFDKITPMDPLVGLPGMTVSMAVASTGVGDFPFIDNAIAMKDGRVGLGYANGHIRIWNPVNGASVEMKVQHAQPNRTTSLHELPDGRLVSHSYGSPTGGRVSIWDPQSGAELMFIRPDKMEEWVNSVTVDGNDLLVSRDRKLDRVNPDTGRVKKSYRQSAGTFTELRRLGDGRIAAQNYHGPLSIWTLGLMNLSGPTLNVHEDWVYGMTELETGKLATFRKGFDLEGADSVFIWDLNEGKLSRQLRADEHFVMRVIHLNKNLLAAAYQDGTVRVWDYQANQVISTLEPTERSPAAVSLVKLKDGRIAIGHSNGSVRLWQWSQSN